MVDSTTPVDLDTPVVTDADRRSALRPDNAAYTLFTSGSTGLPKGVTVAHRAVVNRLRWGIDEFGIGPDDAVMLKTPVGFDVSVPELFVPFMTGARLVIAPDNAHLDPQAVARLIDAERVTTVHFVPSLLTVFVETLRAVAGTGRAAHLLPTLRHLYCSGEALAPATLHEVGAVLPHVQVHNLFGPTEATVEVCRPPSPPISMSCRSAVRSGTPGPTCWTRACGRSRSRPSPASSTSAVCSSRAGTHAART